MLFFIDFFLIDTLVAGMLVFIAFHSFMILCVNSIIDVILLAPCHMCWRSTGWANGTCAIAEQSSDATYMSIKCDSNLMASRRMMTS